MSVTGDLSATDSGASGISLGLSHPGKNFSAPSELCSASFVDFVQDL